MHNAPASSLWNLSTRLQMKNTQMQENVQKSLLSSVSSIFDNGIVIQNEEIMSKDINPQKLFTPLRKNVKDKLNDNHPFSEMLKKYLLTDYTFLQDYVVVESLSSKQFIARIVNTDQQVLFTKVPLFGVGQIQLKKILERFQVLVELFEQGIILADSMFILEEQSGHAYIYIIQAYLENENRAEGQNIQDPITYSTLTEHLERINDSSSQQLNLENVKTRRKLLDKVKILLDCIHQRGQPYFGLTPEKIILDDESNVYLAPFKIDIFSNTQNGKRAQKDDAEDEIKTSIEKYKKEIVDNYTRAYYSPEILRLGENKNGLVEISPSRLVKNDIWSFGCIAMEIFLYSSPVFYAPTSLLQTKAIEQFFQNSNHTFNEDYLLKEVEEAYSLQQNENQKELLLPLINIILNSLQLEESERVLCSQRISCGSETKRQLNRHSVSSRNVKTINKNAYSLSKDKTNKKQRNPKLQQIFFFSNINASNKGNNIQRLENQCQFTMKVLFISDITFRKQLRLNIYLDKQYSIFVEKSQHNRHKVDQNIRITSQNYSHIYEILSVPILVQVREDEKCGKIWVNLATLVMTTADGKSRVWNKPLIGSYGVQNLKNKENMRGENFQKFSYGTDFSNCKIKLSCELKTPQNSVLLHKWSELRHLFKEDLQKFQWKKTTAKKKQVQQTTENILKEKHQNSKIGNTKNNEEEELKNENISKLQNKEHLSKIYNNLRQISDKWGFKKDFLAKT